MTETPIADRLADLDREVDAAKSRWEEARRRAERDPFSRVRPAVADLARYRDDVDYRRPRAEVGADEETQLTRELVARIEEDGFVLRAVRAGSVGMLLLWDPEPDAAAAAAQRELLEARQDRDAFARTHSNEIEAERKLVEMAELRAAMEGDEPERVRAILDAGKEQVPTGA